jgi:hypothetical protein
MEVMRKEIARLNEIIGKGCLSGKAQVSDKKTNDSRVPQFKQGRHPSIKHGLGHTAGAKTNGRKVINGYECVQFMSKGKVGTEQPAQKVAQKQPRAAQPAQGSSAAVKGGSATPHRKGKATSSSFALVKPKKKVYQPKQEPQRPKKSIWGNPNKYAYQPKAHAPRQSLSSCFVLKNNSKGEVIAKYVGNNRNVYLNTSIWVPKILVTNMQGPKNIWGPKSRN